MNFEQRKSTAKEELMIFLSTMAAPRGIGDSALATIIDSISDAFARKMPVKGDYAELVRTVLLKVKDTHMSNTWPAQAVFVLAMPSGEAMGRPAPESFRVDNPIEHYSKLMREGESIPETAIWGVLSSHLPRVELEQYRNASVLSWVETYRNEASHLMASKYGSIVTPYFSLEAAE